MAPYVVSRILRKVKKRHELRYARYGLGIRNLELDDGGAPSDQSGLLSLMALCHAAPASRCHAADRPPQIDHSQESRTDLGNRQVGRVVTPACTNTSMSTTTTKTKTKLAHSERARKGPDGRPVVDPTHLGE
ncbi:hypothetical protein ONS96_009535 [Cadophora gregata f. sp. sojae]|nr:hypothetical protein ONS96_009535 [Cadophora gregata f. sp. sojae]